MAAIAKHCTGMELDGAIEHLAGGGEPSSTAM
jgi:hypothetical protein